MKPVCALIPMLFLASVCGSVSNSRPTKSDAGPDAQDGAGDASAEDEDASGADRGPSKPPKATDSITLRGNLDQSAPLVDWKPSSPVKTSDFATNLVIYDSLGKPIRLDLFFVKDDAAKTPSDSGAWSYHAMTDGVNLQFQSDGATSVSPGTLTQIAAGTLRFDTSGRLVSNVTTSRGFYPKNARAPQTLTFNFGTGTAVGGSGLDGLTQYVAASIITFVDQSGAPYVP